MATSTLLTGTTYAEVAADVTALTLIQCPSSYGNAAYRGVELVVAADTPAASVRGIELSPGETITSANIADLGASGKLYARPAFGNSVGELLTL